MTTKLLVYFTDATDPRVERDGLFGSVQTTLAQNILALPNGIPSDVQAGTKIT